MRFFRRGAALLIVVAMISADVAGAEKRKRVGGKKAQTPVAAAATPDTAGAEERWHEIQTIQRPDKLVVACDEFLRNFPASPLEPQVRIVQASALQAIKIQRSAGLSRDLFEDAVGDSDYRENLVKAVRGDKDAAYRIARGYKTGSLGVDASPRRREQWLRFSAELGSGVASWELAEIYNNSGLVADAAHFEKMALGLGYQPPIRLPSRGY